MVVLDDPPYDVLLGEVPGTKKFHEDPSLSSTSGKEEDLQALQTTPGDAANSNSSIKLPLQQTDRHCPLPTHSTAVRPHPLPGIAQGLPSYQNQPVQSCLNHRSGATQESEDRWHFARRNPNNWRQTAPTSTTPNDFQQKPRFGRCGRRRRQRRKRLNPNKHIGHTVVTDDTISSHGSPNEWHDNPFPQVAC